MSNNTCLLQLLNNYGITTINISDIIDASYSKARHRVSISDFSIVEANKISKHLNIPLTDFAEILEGNKDILKKYLIK